MKGDYMPFDFSLHCDTSAHEQEQHYRYRRNRKPELGRVRLQDDDEKLQSEEQRNVSTKR